MYTAIRPIAEDFVAEVSKVNLALNLPQAVAEELRDAFSKYAVLILRDQFDVEYQQLLDFAGFFGRPSACMDITNLDVGGNILDPESLDARYTRGNALWHMDMLVLERPPLAAMLVARELPASGGGHTEFADLSKVWSSYSPAERRMLEKLKAVHTLETIRAKMGITKAEEIQSEYPPREHPLVCVDPLSNKQALLFGAHTSHIVGLSSAESDALLADLLNRATRKDGIYTHEWRPYDLVLWSNRRAMHRVLPYEYRHERRRLWRMEVLTDERPANVRAFSWRRLLPW
ncbi:MAG: TauD/TfdA family dioxygenase [Reyranella sp.]|jgi:alpha-ketoglutarate-dependent 2,4-dichlorophenoxyacetate dioxygenase|nr:TauD/TfdA family dioxygenase [Reyranella sp.]